MVDITKGAKEEWKTKEKTTQYEKEEDYNTAKEDFNSLKPNNLLPLNNPNNARW